MSFLQWGQIHLTGFALLIFSGFWDICNKKDLVSSCFLGKVSYVTTFLFYINTLHQLTPQSRMQLFEYKIFIIWHKNFLIIFGCAPKGWGKTFFLKIVLTIYFVPMQGTTCLPIEVTSGPNVFETLYDIFGYDKKQYAPGQLPRFKKKISAAFGVS